MIQQFLRFCSKTCIFACHFEENRARLQRETRKLRLQIHALQLLLHWVHLQIKLRWSMSFIQIVYTKMYKLQFLAFNFTEI